MKARIKGLWVKGVLAFMALPTSLAHATDTSQWNPFERSLGNSMDWAAMPGNDLSPRDNLLLGSMNTVSGNL